MGGGSDQWRLPLQRQPGQPTNKRDRFIAAEAGGRGRVLRPPHGKAPQPQGPAGGAAPGRGTRAAPGSARAGTGPAQPPPSLGGAAIARPPRQGPAARGWAAATKQPSQTRDGYSAR